VRALLLAAGRGKRAGGPKAWLAHDGRTLLEAQVSFLLSRFRPEEVFVSIQADWMERCRGLASTVRWIPADPDAPAFASLKLLLEAGGAYKDWAYAHHVDMPVWESGLFDALATAASEAPSGVEAVVPRFEGRRGHPVLLSPSAQKALRALDAATGRLDRWLGAAHVEEVETDLPCVRENWNEGRPA
jgi:CTP:molybdopterin cytidylyltransferase MocA